jgi:hypothetical protein
MPSNGSTADGPTCDTMAGHVMDLLAKGTPDAPPDVIKKLHDTLQRHCDQDAWTVASRSCFATMQTQEQGKKCEDGLSEAQKKSLDSETMGDDQKSNAVTAPPKDPKSGGTRGTPKKGGDPCDGGE